MSSYCAMHGHDYGSGKACLNCGVPKPAVVPSESDRRTVNNMMRHQYRVLSEEEKLQMVAFKDKALEFVELCESVGTSRELSLAITNMQQACFWAVSHITR